MQSENESVFQQLGYSTWSEFFMMNTTAVGVSPLCFFSQRVPSHIVRRSHICERFKNASLEDQQSRWKKFDSGVSSQQNLVLGLGVCVGAASGAAPAHICLDRHSEELITCVITLQLPPFHWRGSRSATLLFRDFFLFSGKLNFWPRSVVQSKQTSVCRQ